MDWQHDPIHGGQFIATLEKTLCDKICYDRGLSTLTQTQMLEYLDNDLRAELPHHLDLELIHAIAEAYRSKNLRTLASVLKKYY